MIVVEKNPPELTNFFIQRLEGYSSAITTNLTRLCISLKKITFAILRAIPAKIELTPT